MSYLKKTDVTTMVMMMIETNIEYIQHPYAKKEEKEEEVTNKQKIKT